LGAIFLRFADSPGERRAGFLRDFTAIGSETARNVAKATFAPDGQGARHVMRGA
jgi:hypothetical protein